MLVLTLNNCFDFLLVPPPPPLLDSDGAWFGLDGSIIVAIVVALVKVTLASVFGIAAVFVEMDCSAVGRFE